MEEKIGPVGGCVWENLRWEFDEYNRKTYAAPLETRSIEEQLQELKAQNEWLMSELREALRENWYGKQDFFGVWKTKGRR